MKEKKQHESYKILLYVLCLVVGIILVASCGKDSIEDSIVTEEQPRPEGKFISISLEAATPASLKIHYEPTEDVAYYKCGKGDHPSNLKNYSARTVKYDRLDPETEYTFTAYAFDSTDHVIEQVSTKFKTTEIPYYNYMRRDDLFYPISYADMRIESLANGHKKKCLRFVGQTEGCWFQVAYISAAYESVSKMWDEGTYNFDANSTGPRYYAEYNLDQNSIHYVEDGKMVIKRGGSIFNITVTDDYGVKLVQFAGSIQ